MLTIGNTNPSKALEVLRTCCRDLNMIYLGEIYGKHTLSVRSSPVRAQSSYSPAVDLVKSGEPTGGSQIAC